MSAPDCSIVRIFGSGDQAVGAGFLVARTMVMTCAHVVQAALGSSDIDASVLLDFPLIKSNKIITGQVVFIDHDKDIACLEIAESLPKDAKEANLVLSENLWEHKFRAFGFPSGYKNGVWSSGVLRGNIGDGWLQIEDVKESGYIIQPGFSGGPIWDDNLQAVVGMIVAAETDKSVKAAFCIPARGLVNVYPALADVPNVLCPYRSLDVFNEEDKLIFFGRERVIERLLSSLKQEPRFLAVLGTSGSGKSSVVRAGLIPALKEGKVFGGEKLHVMTIRPGAQPFMQLENVGLYNAQAGLTESVKTWFSDNTDKQRLVLFIDQFEELLVSTPIETREAFVIDTAKLLDSSFTVTIIITLRNDFYSRFQRDAIPLVRWLEGGLVNIPETLEKEELRAMIIKPAARVGVEFERGLVENIITDAIEVDRTQEFAQSSILPLLEFALTQLWEARRGNLLSHDAYLLLGGVGGGLSQWADKAYHNLEFEERLAARRILTGLVNLGDEIQGTQNTKRTKRYTEIAHNEVYESVIQKLVQARLLVTGFDIGFKQNLVELIHEALIYKWSKLSIWIKEDREDLSIYNKFSENATEWDKAGRDNGLLYRGGRLAALIQWYENLDDEPLTVLEQDFLEESKIQETEVLENARLMKSAQERVAQLEALNRVAFFLTSSLQSDEWVASLFEQLRPVLPFDTATLLLLQQDKEQLMVVAASGFSDSEKRIGLIVAEENSIMSQQIIHYGQPIAVADVREDSRFPQVERSRLSWLGVPLIYKGDVIGAITFEKQQANSYNSEQVQVAMNIANQVVVALKNARLFEQAQTELEFRRKVEIELRNSNQLLQFQIERVELLQEQLKELAIRDSLTNLFNRRYLHEILETKFARSRRSQTSLAILMIDSDHLKDINDKYGHKAGDDFLVYIANVIRENIHAGDIACRYGGDEFVAMLSNVTENAAFARAEKLRESIFSRPILHENEKVSTSASIGIAMFPTHGSSGEELLQKADLALYAAKRMGKNKVLIYSEGLE